MSIRMPYNVTSWRIRSSASSRDRLELLASCCARPSASCMRSMAFCWNCATTCGTSGVMRCTMASMASIRVISVVCRAAPSRARDSTNASSVALMVAWISACNVSWLITASSMTPGQRSNSLTVNGAASMNCWRTAFCNSTRDASSVVFRACDAPEAVLRPKLSRHSTLPRAMRPMMASRNAGSSERRSSLMRNCRSRKRELTLLISMVIVPAAVSRLVTA